MPVAKGPRPTRAVRVGSLIIGGGFPVSVQTMWKQPLEARGSDSVVAALERLAQSGCDLVRFAVPDLDAAQSLGELARRSPLPLAADVHFDHRIALRCLDFPIAKIRINPGTIGEEWKVREVVAKAADHGVPIRVGINGASLPRRLERMRDRARAMVAAAEEELELLERLSFHEVVVSLKSSDVQETIRANLLFSRRHAEPLHVGITEAGPLVQGLVKSGIGIGTLLARGIGDTIRVSLSASPTEEVLAGNEILRVAGRRSGGVEIVSCPRCGRSTFDVQGFLAQAEPLLHNMKRKLVVAVMGCPVNGPGEARRADLGITGAGRLAMIIRGGEVVRRVPYDEALKAFREELDKLCKDA